MRSSINLNYDWFFKEKMDKGDLTIGNFDGFSKVELPHAQKILPFNNFNWDDYQFISSYKRLIEVKKDPNKNYLLKFLGIAQRSEIYLNGKKLIENKCGHNEINLNITDELKDGINELYVLVDSTEGYFPPFGNIVDYLGYGGIYREAYLEITGEDYILNPFFYSTDLLNEEKSYHLKLSFFKNEENKIRLLVKDNQEVIIDRIGTVRRNEDFSGALPNIELWDVNNPKLYEVVIELLNSKEDVIDSINFNYGFRDIKGTKDGFYLNGKKLTIRGLDRHQAWPYVGYAMPVKMQKRDAHILKYHLGLNAMRCSHYMNHPEFLNECDKIGLLVYEEFPGWQFIGNEEWQEQALTNLDSMILRDRCHPSICFFGVRINESKELLSFNDKCYRRAKELDPTRIITGTHCIKKEKDVYDCYAYNNFLNDLKPKVLDKKKEVTDPKNPYLITEYCGHMHPNKAYDTEYRRVDTSLIHKRIISKVEKEGDVFGAMGWVMADYNTHKGFGPNDMICYHGVLDMNRCDKVTSFTYQALQDYRPFLECSSALAPGDYDASEFKAPIIYTNCDKVEVYRDNEYLTTYTIENNIDSRVFEFTDFVGNDLVNKGETEKFQKTFKKTLDYFCKHGLENKFALMFHTNIFKFKKIYEYGQEYLGNITKYTYTFKGYKNNELVCEKKLGYGAFSYLDYSFSSDTLDYSDTYDIESFTVTAKDNLDNVLRYMTDVVEVEVSKGLELISPNKISLIGGNATFYYRNKESKDSTESIRVTFSRPDGTMIDRTFSVQVKKFIK